MISREVWEPCIACGAPVSVGGAGHDEGCPVMATDQQIAASMALAAIDNRATWTALRQTGYTAMYSRFGTDHAQPRGARSDAPLYLSAQTTAERRTPIWILED